MTNLLRRGHSRALGPRLHSVAVDRASKDEAAADTAPSEVGPQNTPARLAFEQVYAAHFEFGWRVLRHLGLNGPALDDGCQELWLVVHRHLPSLELRGEMRTWLFGIAANVARNHRRAELRRATGAELPAHLAHPGLDPEALHSARETWAAVQGFLDTLDDADRWIFVFNVVERMSATETARALGIEVETVYQRVRALRRAIRRWFER